MIQNAMKATDPFRVIDSKPESLRLLKGKVDFVDPFGMTPLLYAISIDNLEESKAAIDNLMNNRADPNFMVGIMKFNAVHYACRKGNSMALKAILEKDPPDMKKTDWKNRTPIVCAIIGGNQECLGHLLSYQPNLAKETQDIQDALLHLDPVSDVPSQMAKLIFKRNSGFDLSINTKNGKSFLKCAIEIRSYKLAEVLLNQGIVKHMQPEEIAACLTETFLIEPPHPLINAFLQFNKVPTTILVNPCINYNGRPLLHYTCTHKYDIARKAIFEQFPDQKDSIDANGNTFLHRACLTNNVYSIEDSFKMFGNNANAKNSNGDTPLHFLMYNPSHDFENNFKMLIDNKADIKMVNNKNQNIFHILAEHNNHESCKILLSNDLIKKEDINFLLSQRDADKRTPIEVASIQRVGTNQGLYEDVGSTEVRNTPEISSWSPSVNTEHQATQRLLSSYSTLPVFTKKPITIDDVKKHIDDGYSVNVCSSEGYPLITCVMKQVADNPTQTLETVKFILNNKYVDPSIPDNVDTEEYRGPLMPIHHAMLLNSIELTQLLIDNGANFIVDPVVHCVAEDTKNEEMMKLVKLPERRASSIQEIYDTQNNAMNIIGAILRKAHNCRDIGNNPKINSYLYECDLMFRLLTMFVQRLSVIYFRLTPMSEIGNFLIYFADAFLPLLGLGANYDVAISEMRSLPALQTFLSGNSYGKLSIDDAMIVPTQQFTRYPDLIKAVIKVTPKEHKDTVPIQKALIKYSYIGRTSNERKMIAESQKELRLVELSTTLNDMKQVFSLDDILYFRGQFEMKEFSPPQGSFAPTKSISQQGNDIVDWGVRTFTSDKYKGLPVTCLHTYGRGFESFLKKSKIAIFLFRGATLFGLQKTSEKFKLKFSFRSLEVLWDFGKEYGPEFVKIYTPFGSMLLKCAPPKGTLANFERNRWRSDVDKLSVIDEADEESPGEELCYASWVGEESKCVHTFQFYVRCQNKAEAREKILAKIQECGCKIKTKTLPTGEVVPLISYDFQTVKKNEGQNLQIVSDVQNY